MKKKVTVCIIIIMAIVALVLYSNRTIGILSDPENETVILNNGTRYTACYDDHTNKDRGWILGKITGSYNGVYYVFSVKGDYKREYIYVAAMGRGRFYKRVN